MMMIYLDPQAASEESLHKHTTDLIDVIDATDIACLLVLVEVQFTLCCSCAFLSCGHASWYFGQMTFHTRYKDAF